MIRSLLAWLDHRTGIQDLVHEALYERIPSGARWRYITGSMLVFAFVTQAVTGIFLWMAYSPSSQTAFESVYYIQYQMAGGWLVRGIHHFMAQAMVVVMALHLLQVVWDGAYRAPREVNHWLGLVLLQLVLGLGLTGYLLPWDQKGYWATNVATNLATLVPAVGDKLQQLAVGGNAYGHHTLTRFFAMHTGVLPVLLVGTLAAHIALFRRHGITAKVTPGRPDEYFWPKQVLFDAAGCLVLLTIVLLCVIHWDLQGLAKWNLPAEHRGAELGAPADPAEAYSAARPEWYYLFLFQLLKYFPGSTEIVGAIVIPGIVMTVFALMPFIGRFQAGHRFNQAFTVFVLLAAVGLTCVALSEDYYVWVAPKLGLSDEKKLAASREFLQAREDAEHEARRAIELINRRETGPDGKVSEVRLIPKQGAVYLLRNDPLTRGQRLFGQHCASCHDYRDPAEKPDLTKLKPGEFVTRQPPMVSGENKVARSGDGKVMYGDLPVAGAPNLFGFGSRRWIKGLLDYDRLTKVEFGEPIPSPDPKIAANKDHPDNYKRPIDAPYFGNTNHKTGRMATWVMQHAKLLKDDPAKADDDVEAIAAALSAQAQLPGQQAADAKDKALIERGIGLIDMNCTKGCHKFGPSGQLGLAPDLTGYGSYEWMLGLVSDPTHHRFYRDENDRMPSFAKDLAHPENNNVSVRELSLIVDWIRGDYYQAADVAPRLPHSEGVADTTVQLARLTGSPFTTVVAPAANEKQKAERLFAENCAACHNHTDEYGRGIPAAQPSAPNLFGFGSRTWLAGLLDAQKIAGDEYFGQTRHAKGEMAGFVTSDLNEPSAENKEKIAAIVAALSAEAALPGQAEADKKAADDKTLDKGRQLITAAFDTYACTDCHKFRDKTDNDSAPLLTGWGSKDWLVRFISDPSHADFYKDTNDRMPSFANDPTGPKQRLLTAAEIDLLARWLRGEPLGK